MMDIEEDVLVSTVIARLSYWGNKRSMVSYLSLTYSRAMGVPTRVTLIPLSHGRRYITSFNSLIPLSQNFMFRWFRMKALFKEVKETKQHFTLQLGNKEKIYIHKININKTCSWLSPQVWWFTRCPTAGRPRPSKYILHLPDLAAGPAGVVVDASPQCLPFCSL